MKDDDHNQRHFGQPIEPEVVSRIPLMRNGQPVEAIAVPAQVREPFTMDHDGHEAASKWLRETRQYHLLDKDPKADNYTPVTLANTLWVQQHGGVEREFEIWVEGYQATGESSTASLVGKSMGWTFYDAVKNLAARSHKGRFDWYGGRWSIWGCRLFDNEADARKSFG